MLDAFSSVGARQFDVTWTNQAGNPQLFRRGKPLTELAHDMPVMLDQATTDQRNLIVRPYGPPAVFLQLDDLDAASLARVQPAAFLTLITSPGNHQAWVALGQPPAEEDFARRLRKGAGADPTASGATRVAGSLNVKDKYAPDFPRVAIGHVQPGRIVTPAALDAMGLVTAHKSSHPAEVAFQGCPGGRRAWPDYQRCLDGAPAKRDGSGPDVSRADFTFALIAADWGRGVEEIAERLMAESLKAQENGQTYASTTARNGAAAAARNRRSLAPP